MAKGKKKPPSRVRYEVENPTVSCRITREIYDRLQGVKAKGGRSFADILKIGLGILEVKAVEEGVVEDRYADGWGDGFRDAESTFKVTYHCSVCGELMEVNTVAETRAAGECMERHGWGHASCHEKNTVG